MAVNRSYLLSSEQLHTQQCEDDDEEEQQEQQRYDGAHGVEQRDDQVPQRGPVPEETDGLMKLGIDIQTSQEDSGIHIKPSLDHMVSSN